MSTVKVGDVVAWDKVPSGAAVRKDGNHAIRQGDYGSWANTGSIWWPSKLTAWQWSAIDQGTVMVIALGLTGQETAADLQRLAEVYEVREAWERLMLESRSEDAKSNQAVALWFADNTRNARVFFELLHNAGWRPGMTAEDAARLLAEVQS